MSESINIIQLGSAVLRQFAQPIIEINSVETQNLICRLLIALAESAGVGIAAPQIGESYCIIVIASKPTPRYPNAPLMQPLVMINPKLTNVFTQHYKDWEGCLSIPGIRALVPRYRQIQVEYTDINGENRQLELSDFTARIFQHEYDHLHGLVYLDRVENNRDIISETEFYKLFAA
jgi:peptide deformylase